MRRFDSLSTVQFHRHAEPMRSIISRQRRSFQVDRVLFLDEADHLLAIAGAHPRKCQTSTASPAEPGELPMYSGRSG